MQNVEDVLDLWPSMAELSRDLSVPYQTVSAWRLRRSIPPAYWRDLVRSAGRRGLRDVTSDLLMELHARSAEPSNRAPEVREPPVAGGDVGAGHFSRFKHLRRTHFNSSKEIDEHVAALREEWDRR